jgi:hypothetical protein
MNDFYVGYLPKAPASLAYFVRKVIVGIGLLIIALAILFVVQQNPFANSVFEYGKPRTFAGQIAVHPYPTLLVARPGDAKMTFSEYLLVAPGKHGAGDLVSAFDGRQVRLQGQLIYRDGKTMIEVVPGSLSAAEPASFPNATRDLGPRTFVGDIVDSKCYLGVMNPGNGKVHRDCAARCLSGGIPPLFITADGNQLVLMGQQGTALPGDALREFIAEPITIQGELLQRGETQFLKIDVGELRHGISNAALQNEPNR